ncbi:MAG: hypothetical protein PHV74_12900 [Dehalococcoidia bacterium]|nr:hypothetical protein [Dehalococcoidia bacterium]
MTELMNDYSGPLKGDFSLNDLSQEFLAKLAREWQYEFLKFEEMMIGMVKDKIGKEEADKFELALWQKFCKVNVPRIARLANVDMKTSYDFVKVAQLLPEGLMMQPITSYEVINPDHVKLTVHKCLILEWMEKNAPDRIMPMCHQVEVALFTDYIKVLLPDHTCKPIMLPPRKGRCGDACVWEYVKES